VGIGLPESKEKKIEYKVITLMEAENEFIQTNKKSLEKTKGKYARIMARKINQLEKTKFY